MKVLAWLLFPLAATVLAMGWAAWHGHRRSRGPSRSGTAFASVEEFRRFSAVLAAPGPRAAPAPRSGFRRLTGSVRPTGVRRTGPAVRPGRDS